MNGLARLLRLAAGAALVLTLSAPASAVPLPEIPEAKGEHCVEDPAVMRKKHMDYLKHQRDETMHQGIRTTKYSLKQCLECHAPVKESGQAVAQEESGHFCKNCHVYAGVKIDCFECHATRPEGNANFHPMVTPGGVSLNKARDDSGALLNRVAAAHSEQAGANQ